MDKKLSSKGYQTDDQELMANLTGSWSFPSEKMSCIRKDNDISKEVLATEEHNLEEPFADSIALSNEELLAAV